MSKIPEQIAALYLALIIYKEKKFKAKLLKYFLPTAIYVNSNDTDFWSVLVIKKQIWVIVRGTDGTTFYKWLKAWASDFDFQLTSRGRHRGFDISAYPIVNDITAVIRQLYSEDLADMENRVIFTGHSRAASMLPIIMYEIKNKITEINLDMIGYQFSAFPCGDQRFADDWNRYHTSGRLKMIRYINPRDIASYKKFREKNNITPKGVDIDALEITLPPDTFWQKLFRMIPGFIEHRPQELFDGFKLIYSKHKRLLNGMRREL
jgi:hypothetical protein